MEGKRLDRSLGSAPTEALRQSMAKAYSMLDCRNSAATALHARRIVSDLFWHDRKMTTFRWRLSRGGFSGHNCPWSSIQYLGGRVVASEDSLAARLLGSVFFLVIVLLALAMMAAGGLALWDTLNPFVGARSSLAGSADGGILPTGEVVAETILIASVFLLFGGGLLIACLVGWLGDRKRQAKRQQASAVQITRPGMLSRSDGFDYRWPQLVGTLCMVPPLIWLLLVFLGRSGPVPFDEYVRWHPEPPWMFLLSAFMALFLVVAGLIWLKKASEAKAHFDQHDGAIGDIALQLRPYYPKLGGPVGGRFHLDFPEAYLELCQLTAELYGSSWYRPTSNGKGRYCELFRQQQPVVCEWVTLPDGQRMIRCEFEFDTSAVRIPPDHLERGSFGWCLTIEGRVDLHEFKRIWGMPIERSA